METHRRRFRVEMNADVGICREHGKCEADVNVNCRAKDPTAVPCYGCQLCSCPQRQTPPRIDLDCKKQGRCPVDTCMNNVMCKYCQCSCRKIIFKIVKDKIILQIMKYIDDLELTSTDLGLDSGLDNG